MKKNSQHYQRDISQELKDNYFNKFKEPLHNYDLYMNSTSHDGSISYQNDGLIEQEKKALISFFVNIKSYIFYIFKNRPRKKLHTFHIKTQKEENKNIELV